MQLFGFLSVIAVILHLLPLEVPFVIGLGKRLKAWQNKPWNLSQLNWFTNLDGKGERGATEMFLHHVADPLCRTEQISHLLGTQVTETLHRPQGTNEDIWGWQCQGSNTNLSAPEQSQPPACNLVLIALESPELFLSGDTARASETQG